MLKLDSGIKWQTTTSRWRDVASATGKPVWLLYTMEKDCLGCIEVEELCDDKIIVQAADKFICIKYIVTPDDPILNEIHTVPSSMFLTCRGQITNHMGVSVFPTPHSDVESLRCHLEGGFNLASKALRKQ